MPEQRSEVEVLIEYDEFIAGRELSEILEVLDASLSYEIEREFDFPPFYFRHPYLRRFEERPSALFCVKKISDGSLIITGVLSGAAATYCYNRFAKGFRPKRFGDQIERFGRSIGDNIEAVVERMNVWLEEYAESAREKNSRIKSIRAKRKTTDDEK